MKLAIVQLQLKLLHLNYRRFLTRNGLESESMQALDLRLQRLDQFASI
jgi:hypothetical protein